MPRREVDFVVMAVWIRRRAKSGGNLSPFTFTPSSPMSTSISGPANLFSSTSPSPFARSLGPADLGPLDSAAPGAQQTADYHHPTPSSHRASFLFDQQAAQNLHNHIHSESKNLSPDQVMELVQGLRSPVLATHQDEIPPASTPKRSGLSRSSSLARIRAESEVSNVSRALDEGKAGAGGEAAGGLELEPVEYVEMNDDVLLPFVDRVAEVAELVEQPSNVSSQTCAGLAPSLDEHVAETSEFLSRVPGRTLRDHPPDLSQTIQSVP